MSAKALAQVKAALRYEADDEALVVDELRDLSVADLRALVALAERAEELERRVRLAKRATQVILDERATFDGMRNGIIPLRKSLRVLFDDLLDLRKPLAPRRKVGKRQVRHGRASEGK